MVSVRTVKRHFSQLCESLTNEIEGIHSEERGQKIPYIKGLREPVKYLSPYHKAFIHFHIHKVRGKPVTHPSGEPSSLGPYKWKLVVLFVLHRWRRVH